MYILQPDGIDTKFLASFIIDLLIYIAHTVYSKTFEWENFQGLHNFTFNRKYFPANFC